MTTEVTEFAIGVAGENLAAVAAEELDGGWGEIVGIRSDSYHVGYWVQFR